MGTSAVIRDGQLRAMPGNRRLPPPSVFLGVLPPELWDKPKRFFLNPFVGAGLTNLAAGATNTGSIQTDPKYHYVAFYGCLTVRANAAGKAIQNDFPLTVSLSDSNNRSYNPAQSATDVGNVFGNAKQPSVWAMPMILEPGITLTASFVNLHNATAVDLFPALMGFLVEYDGQISRLGSY